jgi:acetylornithine deacetylase/succinyl-diaminopimelate desuccinylase-like protein
VPGQTVDGVKRDLRRVLRRFAEKSGQPEPAIHVYVSDPPTVLDENLAIIQGLRTAQQAVSGESPAAIIRRPGADAVHLTAYGVPCVAFGPGGRTHPDTHGASMHAFGEHVLIDDCVLAARIYLALALDLCNRKAAS